MVMNGDVETGRDEESLAVLVTPQPEVSFSLILDCECIRSTVMNTTASTVA